MGLTGQDKKSDQIFPLMFTRIYSRIPISGAGGNTYSIIHVRMAIVVKFRFEFQRERLPVVIIIFECLIHFPV